MDRRGSRAEVGEGFPEKVTAFREEMAVHGRFGEPCPDCGAPVQRIVYASQRGELLRRRARPGASCSPTASLSRLLKDDWPRTLEELEARGLGARK